ncbi:ABC transporter substrate-binding protein [Nonomuraea diastatica]|uniref:ABC transporter substrate-binding protein n=1 Tax=Nonomuraea diastatica TaxID=1848329 RepID=A0A4R4WU79_9ACTN|nr:ABC transporter substrate-binding protein [Nonomuraea diastatica]TDD21249.1 ABC transporter substrate-binding protein [Nonomuraea diastatica]
MHVERLVAGAAGRGSHCRTRSYPEILEALRAGQVSAALLAEPFVTVGRETGQVRIVADTMSRDFANLHTAGITATDEWVRENPRTLAAFQRALVKAQRLIASDPQQVRHRLHRGQLLGAALPLRPGLVRARQAGDRRPDGARDRRQLLGHLFFAIGTPDGQHTIAVHTNTEWKSWDPMFKVSEAEFGVSIGA